MKPEIHYSKCEKEREKPMPEISIDMGYGDIVVTAVSPDGTILANLFSQKWSYPSAERALQKEGYKTDWAEWDSDGRFLEYKGE